VAKIGDAVKLGRGASLADAVADGSIDSLRGLTADELRAAVKGLSAADAEKLAAELAKPELDTSALSSLHLDDLRSHPSTTDLHGSDASAVEPATPSVPHAATPEHVAEYASKDPVRPGDWPPHAVQAGQAGADGGQWTHLLSRDQTKAWAEYQAQITGIDAPAGKGLMEYRVEGPARDVDFDGMTMRGQPPQQVFLEAKDGYASAFDGSQWDRLADIQRQKWLKEATAQLEALPDGAALEWHFSDPLAASEAERLFGSRALDVDVIYTPRA
jgi:hypothetical protein